MNHETLLYPQKQFGIFLLAILIGVIGGIAAWLFRLLIGFIHNFAFFGSLTAVYDANQHTLPSSWGWLIIFVPILGGMVVVWLVKNFAPEAKGHGVPEVIHAIHYNQGIIKGRVSLVKALASAITIGTGGSLGREGPIVQIGSAFSSAIGQWFGLSASQKIVLISCGASAGIAATFNAPLAGVLFSIELLLVTTNSKTLLPVAVSTVIAANVGHYLIGTDPAFTISIPEIHHSVSQELMLLPLYFPIGVVIGIAALFFTKCIYWAEDAFSLLPVNDYLRHALGTLLLGLLFYWMLLTFHHYYVQGVGYATIQDILNDVITDPKLMLFLFFAKLLATCLTIGSGGSGGVFSPSLFLGAALGGFIGQALMIMAPGLEIEPMTFAIIGMASMVGASTSAPLTAVIITYEMTQNYSIILPVMLTVCVAYVVRRSLSETDIYTHKLARRGHFIPEGRTSDMSAHLKVRQVMSLDYRFLNQTDHVTPYKGTTLVVDGNQVVGIIGPFNYIVGSDVLAESIMSKEFSSLPPDFSLKTVLYHLDKLHHDSVLICDGGKPLVDGVKGVLTSRDIANIAAKAAQIQHA